MRRRVSRVDPAPVSAAEDPLVWSRTALVRKGSRPSSRRAAIRLSRLTPNRCLPRATRPRSAWGVRRRSHTGQVRAMKTCSVTWAGTRGRSMTSRVRCTQPPARPVPHWGQDSRTCSTRCVGAMRWRAKPWGLGFLGLLSLAGPWPDFGLMPGIRGDPPGLAFPSSTSSLRCNSVMTACCWAMTACKASRLAVVRSRPVSMLQI